MKNVTRLLVDVVQTAIPSRQKKKKRKPEEEILPQKFKLWVTQNEYKQQFTDFCIVYIDDILLFSKNNGRTEETL